ncbi:MAG: Wzt carbohydrate-binding domain-containing protein [Acidobacteria bacterium]|nr:Wzt carbohydrate-binding domain-containing protein [Acidobacteriota bacterium]
MAIEFRQVNFPPLAGFSAAVPDGCVAGVIGASGAGVRELLRAGAVLSTGRYVGPFDDLDLAPAGNLFLDHAFDRVDELARARALVELAALRRAGGAILLASHEQGLLRDLCDEIWWLEEGRLAAKGDPREVLDAYNRRVAQRFREEFAGRGAPMTPSLRRGDGRAELLSLEILGQDGRPAMVLRSGETATVRVRVRFHREVADPVVGILIRSRIGMEVYGTNTELEALKLGPRQAGDSLRVDFRFRCDLCPREYTLTAASHDPNGVWHDWAEDAVAFAVSDSRYTAGVANLRASVEFVVEG